MRVKIRKAFTAWLASGLWAHVAWGAPALPPDLSAVLFVKRFSYTSNHYYTEFINSAWKPGGNLCILHPGTGAVRELLPQMSSGVFGRFDLSFDARRVVFDWKAGPQEGYRIYEVNTDGTGLRQLTFPAADEAALSATYRKRPSYHHGTDDMHPCYLPDGGIAFISTRCRYGILCDPADDFTTTVLYRMDGDGKNMRPLSNSALSESSPVMLPDGRLMYTRWEYVDKGAVAVKCLWAMRPDGTASQEIYGNDIAVPTTMAFGRPIPGAASAYVFLGTPHYPQNGVGTVVRLDLSKPIRTTGPMAYITPDVDIRTEDGFHFRDRAGVWRQDPEGRGRLFRDPYPLSPSLFLVSHKPAGEGWAAAAGYGLYVLDGSGEVAEVYRDPAISCFLPVPLAPRPVPPVLHSPCDAGLAARGLAVCLVQDVYHGLTGVPRGTVRYLRVLEQVPRPWSVQMKDGGDEYDQQHIVISKDTHLGLKVQHGVVPVEDDGSAHFLVPAGRNLFFQALDADYLAVQTERTFVNYMPGEKRACVGCHETPESAARVQAARARRTVPKAFARAPQSPGPQPGETTGQRALHYPSDVQPVFDRHCVACHRGEKPSGEIDLTATPTKFFCRSYEALVPERRRGANNRDPGLLGLVIGENHPKTGNVSYLPAWSLGSHTSVLAALLGAPAAHFTDGQQAARARRLARQHREVSRNVTPEERLRVTNWIDTNAQYYGSYLGRRNLEKYGGLPDFRKVPSFAEAVGVTGNVLKK